jgi:hypothetical protein
MQLEMYIDASYASHSDRKGQSGISIMLGGSPVFVRSIKQKIVAKSSAEAELVALPDEVTNGIWCNNYLIHQHRQSMWGGFQGIRPI